MSGPDPGAVEAFLRHLASERRLSPHTVAAYRRDLEALAAFCRRQGIAAWEALRPWAVRAFAAERRRRGASPRSIARTLSAVRGFYRYLLREGRARLDPAAEVSAPRAPRRLPETLSVEEAAALVEAPGDDPLGRRDRALLELFYSSGLRLGELAALDADGPDLGAGTVRVRGKGGREREVPVGRRARDALAAWLAVRPGLAAPDERALFVSRRGRRLSARAIQARVRHWGLAAGLGRRVHPHLLRHAFATHLLESSGDLRAVQELLGHAHIATTEVYTHLDLQHLARVYDQAHPRARRGRR
ncbi:tyrosine recombinase XerC [Inmirania thermothiophila]|uniref:Tyrosine recombinase XerC n=1 Tax=Inmirania thermothiophila TaxID=1750597 RepID=A0A3N1Y6G2_9GAMM|nr:tyrosine recombinase XerC [Inmirania thermothiophila]ROR34409.1 tyrosine recombinase XerC subunit [Inmirania thermothiophila]